MKLYNKIFSISYFTIFIGVTLNATSLKDSIEITINTNPDIISEHYNKKASRIDIRGSHAGYLPTLDFETYYEDSTTYDDKESSPLDGEEGINKQGWNAALKFEQILYDGGKTPAAIKKATHKYQNIKYTSISTIEGIMLEVTNSYLDLVLNQSLKAFGDHKIVSHNYYLRLANEKEDVSGEILDRLQVESKIRAIRDSNLAQSVSEQKTISQYTKLTNKTNLGNLCKPFLDERLIPSTVEEAIDIALKNDSKIRSQFELMQEKKSSIQIEEAKFYPDLKLQIQANLDNDLKLAEDGQRNIYNVKVISKWNWYEGGKDSSALERERIFMLQQRKVLDAIKNEIIDKTKGSYNSYFQLKKRIANLKEFVSLNNQIVEIYKEQLKDGSRTFMDLLSAETEVFRTRILLEEEIINKYKEYFNILNNLNKLTDTVLSQKNQICKEFDISSILPNHETQYIDKNKDLESDLELESEELGLEE